MDVEPMQTGWRSVRSVVTLPRRATIEFDRRSWWRGMPAWCAGRDSRIAQAGLMTASGWAGPPSAG